MRLTWTFRITFVFWYWVFVFFLLAAQTPLDTLLTVWVVARYSLAPNMVNYGAELQTLSSDAPMSCTKGGIDLELFVDCDRVLCAAMYAGAM